MKRFIPNGRRVKELRQDRERRSTQKELAHEVRISERTLRAIENQNKEIGIEVLDHIAGALGVSRQMIVFAAEGPRLVSPGTDTAETTAVSADASASTVIPRFDTGIASAVSDESAFLSGAKGSHVVLSHILTRLNSETEAYAEELLDLLQSVTWERRDISVPMEGRDELRMRRRLRELLVLLKGNDVWVYATTHTKTLPESDLVSEKRDYSQMQSQLLIAFGPPGEYGEETISVPVDHGQPWIYNPGTLPF